MISAERNAGSHDLVAEGGITLTGDDMRDLHLRLISFASEVDLCRSVAQKPGLRPLLVWKKLLGAVLMNGDGMQHSFASEVDPSVLVHVTNRPHSQYCFQ